VICTDEHPGTDDPKDCEIERQRGADHTIHPNEIAGSEVQSRISERRLAEAKIRQLKNSGYRPHQEQDAILIGTKISDKGRRYHET
jgi:hypothetical protein